MISHSPLLPKGFCLPEPTGVMETILQHLEQFVEMVTVSRSEHVKSWDAHTTKRAFQWAGYFQHIHSRFHANVPVRTALEEKLCDINQRQGLVLKDQQAICFNDLGHCTELLWTTLLQNPDLPPSVCQLLLLDLSESASQGPVGKTMYHVIQQKITSEILLPLFSGVFVGKSQARTFEPLTCHSGWTMEQQFCDGGKVVAAGGGEPHTSFANSVEDNKPVGTVTNEPVLKTQASVLLKHLEDSMKFITISEKEQLVIVHSILAKIPKPRVFRLVGWLLATYNTTVPCSYVIQLLMQWLLGDQKSLSCFCTSLDCELLTTLSSSYAEFRQAYLKFLTSCGKNMEYNILSGQWTSTSPEMSWEGLQYHFKELLKGSSETQEAVERTLKSLKAEEGDYDVGGICVWTDLLLNLKFS